jgi:rhodanese-related sulfurtransferase
MKKAKYIIIAIAAALLIAASFHVGADKPSESKVVSGSVEGGFRVLPIDVSEKEQHYTVYRGDYIKFKIQGSLQTLVLSIPQLSIKKGLPSDFDEAPFFKMKKMGKFTFSLGNVNGTLKVIGYQQANYREVSSLEASQMIQSDRPYILDVRTPREYNGGHLKGSVLIPVQQLQARLNQLAGYKDKQILIYCATGNRSTVASKILIDNGFSNIVNMRYGIVDWYNRSLPVVN